MGGRNQKTQLLRSGWADGAAGPAVGWPTALPASCNEAYEAGLLRALPPKAPSLADFSAVGVFAVAPRAESNGFAADLVAPNEAKAPEPRPKAVAAPPPIGDARLPPGVVAEPNEGFPSDELSPPNRLKEGLRPEALSWPDPVERESLLELPRRWLKRNENGGREQTTATHLARRLHRLSMKKSETVTRWEGGSTGERAVGRSTGSSRERMDDEDDAGTGSRFGKGDEAGGGCPG